MTITYDKQILIKRGNTAEASTYVGPLGELVLNTDSNRVYVHNGVTVGGTLVGDGVGTNYSNINAAAYLPTDATITSLIANAGAQSSAISTLTANAATQAGQISALQANIGGNYSNSNVAAYLPTYNGNIKISNITFSDLSQQRTAYTGQSWRTLLESNLQSKPTWLAYVPDGSKPTVGVNFGFDSTGMWFTGNANDQHAYPIRTNVNFYETDSTEIITTIQYNNIADDHGFAIFNSATTQPFWRFGTDSTRIAYQISVATPELRGRTTSSVAGAPVLVIGNNYTIRMVYDPLAPTNKITVELYDGVSITGALLDTRTINEQLPAGSYEIGFDADQDNLALKSYYTSLTIKTLTNAVFNEIEIINDLAVGGNISSGAVLYSPATSSNWSGIPPTTIGAAIDRLASVVKALNGGTGA